MPQTPPPARAAQPAKPRAPQPPPEFEEGALSKMDAPALIRILTDAGAPEFQKAKACQRAGELGAREAVPALSALLGNERLATYARYGLEPIADPSVDEALRAALPKLKGNLRIGVINSIGKRRDAKASPALAKLIYDADANVARAAAESLGSIGSPTSVKDLQAALLKTSGLTNMAVADACLLCAERLLAAGKRDEAMAIYASVGAPGMPSSVRVAALQGIIREEMSPGHSR